MKRFPQSSVLFSTLIAGVLAFAGLARAQEMAPAKAPAAGDASMDGAAKASGGGITDAEIRDVVSRVARHIRTKLEPGDYPEVKSVDEAEAARRPKGIKWGYPWGVALYGSLRSVDATGDQAADAYVVEHDSICADYYEWLSGLKKSVTNASGVQAFLRNTNIQIRPLLTLGNLDSCGAMGNQLLEMMLRHPDKVTPAEKAVAARIADWILNKQDRLPNGTLYRARQNKGSVWPDDLYMGCPFMLRWSKFTGESKYLDDAASQVIHQYELEADKDGIWFHGYSVPDKKHSPFKWGRGNGWVTVATVEILSALPENHPSRAKLIEILRKQIDGLKPLQAPDGMWRQVLDHPELWEETSCTAMFAYGIARAVNRGWLDESYMPIARKAFAGVAKHVNAEGAVSDTCIGTNIGQDIDYYVKRDHPGDDHHGHGPVLLAGTELLMAKKK
jgi:unsaturated rhamnogalacturonyl hydrolase